MLKIFQISFLLLILTACSDSDPSDIVNARRHVEDYDISPVTFRSMDAFFPVQRFNAGAAPRVLEENIVAFDGFRFGEDQMAIDEVLVDTDTNALLILDNGKIVFERYRNGANKNSRFIGWSMSKSVVSLLIGIAIDEGRIKNLDETVGDYLPELANTPFGPVTLKNMLRMRAGSSYKEGALFGQSHLGILVEQSLYQNQRHFTDIATLGLKSAAPPGDTFNYSTLTSSILGRVMEAATQQTLATYLEEKIWIPAGMEYSGYWLTDAEGAAGHAFGGGGINATARDYARLGQLVLDYGRYEDKQIIPADWIKMSATHEGDPVIPNTPRGYGLHWWTLIDTDIFEAVGIHGQFISIDPATGIVIVKLSYWPARGGGSYARKHISLFEALRAYVVEQR